MWKCIIPGKEEHNLHLPHVHLPFMLGSVLLNDSKLASAMTYVELNSKQRFIGITVEGIKKIGYKVEVCLLIVIVHLPYLISILCPITPNNTLIVNIVREHTGIFPKY